MHTFEPVEKLAPTEFGSVDGREVLVGESALLGTGRDCMRVLSMWLKEGRGENGRALRAETVAYASRNPLDDLPLRPLPAVVRARTRGIVFFGIEEVLGVELPALRGGCPTGRAAGSLSGGGFGNLYFWIDTRNRIAGFRAAQHLPFLHQTAVAAFEAFEIKFYRARLGGKA